MFVNTCIVLQTPTEEELVDYVSPIIKEMWLKIGALLALPTPKLQDIRKIHGKDSHSCCVMMLMEWSLGQSATWKCLLSAIDRVVHKTQSTVESNNNDSTLDVHKTQNTVELNNNNSTLDVHKTQSTELNNNDRTLDDFRKRGSYGYIRSYRFASQY